MIYDVYWVKNRAEKIADFEHPTHTGRQIIITSKRRAIGGGKSFVFIIVWFYN